MSVCERERERERERLTGRQTDRQTARKRERKRERERRDRQTDRQRVVLLCLAGKTGLAARVGAIASCFEPDTIL